MSNSYLSHQCCLMDRVLLVDSETLLLGWQLEQAMPLLQRLPGAASAVLRINILKSLLKRDRFANSFR